MEFCNDVDMVRGFSIVADVFGDREPYFNVAFPNNQTAKGRAQGADRLLQGVRGDSHARTLKVTDTDTGKMIGFANWLVYEDKPDSWNEPGGDYWDDEDQKAYAAHLYKEYMKPRREGVEAAKGPLLSLDLLCVDPKHQYRGAGSKLVKWSVELADQMNAEI
ncbi:MAG: hypothetical protein M1816_000968 [Peltula sp. TS41687]|nr:MAG: hypothetical protein M1816_000968 [Peltula sp. TS41687]